MNGRRYRQTNSLETDDDILIVGVGNEFRGDDALGLFVVRELRRIHVEGVSLAEVDGEGMSLIETWRSHKQVMLIDAFSSGAAPGLLHCLDASIVSLPSNYFGRSTHSFGVAEAIELARRIDLLPSTFLVLGIEGRTFAHVKRLSRTVRTRIPELMDMIFVKIHELERAKSYSDRLKSSHFPQVGMPHGNRFQF